MNINQVNEKIAKLEKDNKRLLAENQYLTKKLEKKPRKKKPIIEVVEQTNDYMRVRIDECEVGDLASNEMVLPFWQFGGKVTKLIWFDVNEDMVYDEEFKMEFPKSFYKKIEALREVKKQREEEQRKRHEEAIRKGEERIAKEKEKPMSEEEQKRREAVERDIQESMSTLKANHTKTKQQIIIYLKEEINISIERYFQKYFSSADGFAGVTYENITEQEVLQAIDDVPLIGEEKNEVFTWALDNLKKILLQIKDNRNFEDGVITGECLEYCLELHKSNIEQYCIIRNYKAKMMAKGIEENQLPTTYQNNKYKGNYERLL